MTPYGYALSITSQFPFCSIPFRLDSYSACQFSCRYCFASTRGGFTGEGGVQLADPSSLERRLKALATRRPRSAIDEMLAARVPLHFGGMSDPFMPLELKSRVTLRLLQILQRYNYPTVVSTKSELGTHQQYLELLANRNFIVQVSLSISDDRLGALIDVGAPLPSRRLRAIEHFRRAGVATSCRIQPVLPGAEKEASRTLQLCASAGAQHVSVEHLKVPIERDSPQVKRLNASLAQNLQLAYRDQGAQRIGREWVLPPQRRLPTILEMREAAWKLGLSFGAADNDLLPLSDGRSCCSGVDLLGLRTAFQFTYTHAVHAARRGQVRFSNIETQWHPRGSIGKFVNSRSRLPGCGIAAYIKDSWNGSANGSSPCMFYGVERTDQYDADGLMIYRLSGELRSLVAGVASKSARDRRLKEPPK